MKSFEAKVTREGKWWMVRVVGVDGVTQARRLSEARLMAREFVASTLEMPLDDIEVDLSVTDIGDVHDIAAIVASIQRERAQAEVLERVATQTAADLAKRLVEQNIPLRDVGTVLGVSHQRAHQLVSS